MEIEEVPGKLEKLDMYVYPLLMQIWMHEGVAEKAKQHFTESRKLNIDIEGCIGIVNALLKVFNDFFNTASIKARFGQTEQDKIFFSHLLDKTRNESLKNLVSLAEYLKGKSEIYDEAKKVLKPERNERNFDAIITLLREISEALVKTIENIHGHSGKWRLLWPEGWVDIFGANSR